MAVSGRLELTIKINNFPTDIRTDKNGWKEFEVDCEGQVVSVTVKPKVFKKLSLSKRKLSYVGSSDRWKDGSTNCKRLCTA